MVAGKQYATSAAHQKKWGKHYRQEWNTAVKIRVAMLDTLAGGLTPFQPSATGPHVFPNHLSAYQIILPGHKRPGPLCYHCPCISSQ